MPTDDTGSTHDTEVPRDRVNLAAGVLMARHHLGAHEAYGLIMDRARMTDRTVGAVVDQVLHRAPRPGGGP